MVLSVVVLDAEENFIQYLNNDYIKMPESNEQYGLRTLSVEYFVEGLADYKKLFRVGNKLWVSGDDYIEDCLYIINTPVKNDLFENNNVVFDAEEKLVELNNAFFSQTSIPAYNDTNDTNDVVNINYQTLYEWFGKYFNIGIIQKCLSDYMEKITPVGTMTLMELLRFIETETGNVFKTTYEKDPVTNKIHCYLNFLNPKSTSKQWELHLFYQFPDEEIIQSPEIPESEDIVDEGDIVHFPDYTPEKALNPNNIQFRLRFNDEILFEENAIDLGFTRNNPKYEFLFEYNQNNLDLTINGESISYTGLIIPNGTVFEMYDAVEDKVVYKYTLLPRLGKVHEEILNLGHNVENITFETDESDTFTAIAPKINQNDNLTIKQLNTLIQKWIDLSVEKGTTVPMIVQKMNITGDENNPCTSLANAKSRLGTFNLSSNYWSRPIKANDSVDTSSNNPNNSYEFWVGTAYWEAPFNKISDELFVADDDITGIEYTHIQGNQDNLDETTTPTTLKIGGVETSDEDPYAIYNAVCMKLKDKRYPEINLDVVVANFMDNLYNNYNPFDTVYVKIPGFEKHIMATVLKTEKNPFDITENKIELGNYSVNTKVAPKKTYIESNSKKYDSKSKKTLTARLMESESDPVVVIPNKLLTFTVYSVENDSQTLTHKIYTKTTDDFGNASINLNLEAGDYIVEVQFGGDTEYSATTTQVKVNIGGKKVVKKKTTIKDTKKVKRYYSSNGVSPNKDHDKLAAIGTPSTGNAKKDKKFYLTIFQRRCPDCGSRQLYWHIFWAKDKYGNVDEHKSVGKFPKTGKIEKGSNKGRIICKKCGHKWNALGESLSNGKKLKVTQKSRSTTKAKAYELKNGTKVYDSVYKEYKVVKKLGNNKSEMARDVNNTGIEYSDVLTKKVRDTAKKIVDNSTGIPAAKKLAKWVANNIKGETRAGLYQSPNTTLNRGRGNCLCHVDLFFQMCDAVGVTEKYDLYYIWVGAQEFGKRHFFAKINGVYVDPTPTYKKNPWGHAGFCHRKIRKTSKYPKLPLSRRY